MTDAKQIDLDNPLGVDGFEFVEFTGPNGAEMVSKLELMGFTQTHVNPKTDVVRLKQGDISFLVHRKPQDRPDSQAATFAKDHAINGNRDFDFTACDVLDLHQFACNCSFCNQGERYRCGKSHILERQHFGSP